jgi:hypothetical protein
MNVGVAGQFQASVSFCRRLILPDGIMSAIGDAFVEEIGKPELAGKGKIAAD